MRHIKLAFRTLFKTPFVTAVAVISLALGIGANAAIFSLFDQMLLRSLPVPDPGRLVNLSAPGPKPGSQSCGQAGDCDEVFSYSMFRDLERTQTVLSGLAAHVEFGANLSYRDAPMSGQGVLSRAPTSRLSGSARRSAACSPRTTMRASGRTSSPCFPSTTGSPTSGRIGRWWGRPYSSTASP